MKGGLQVHKFRSTSECVGTGARFNRVRVRVKKAAYYCEPGKIRALFFAQKSVEIKKKAVTSTYCLRLLLVKYDCVTT
jgi:hypothetical protein